MPKHYIVTTTINLPRLLKDYAQDAASHNHNFQIVVAGDLKTPTATRSFCQSLPNVIYLDVEDQAREFGHLSFFKYIPLNSIDRRNFAYLYCLRQGLSPEDMLITIDDDNFLREEDFIGLHYHQTLKSTVISAMRPAWYNPLEQFYHTPIFFRGFSPYDRRKNSDRNVTISNATLPIAVNQGLWEGNPDVDALTRLSRPMESYTLSKHDSLILSHNILSPFDTQNTAYLNNFWLTAFLTPTLGRHDDIFSSFVTKRIADHLGFGISYGSPIVFQDRNDHDDYQDFLLELHGMSQTDMFSSFLYTINLKSTSILDTFATIATALKNDFPSHPLHHGYTDSQTKLWDVGQISLGMKLWLDAFDQLNISEPSIPHIAHQIKAAA